MKNLNNKSSSNLELLGEERNTPLNYEAERALLGAILSNNKAFESIEDILTSNDFADPLHQKIFSYIKKIMEKGQIADINVIKIHVILVHFGNIMKIGEMLMKKVIMILDGYLEIQM